METASFSTKKLSKTTPIVVIVAAIVVAGAFIAITKGSFLGFVILAIILSVVFYVVATWVVEGKRSAINNLAASLVYGAFLIALVPLISVIYSTLVKGIPGLTGNFFWYSMNGVTGYYDKMSAENGMPIIGGAYHAILGTLLITLMATMISVPIGLMTSIYLVEYGNNSKLAKAITFFVDVMTGIPSIVAGLFAYSLFALIFGPGTKTGAVGAVALSVLMIPVVVRSSEEMLRLVPHELREATWGLGVPKWKTIVKIVLPTAISGIVSGITIAIARVIGETAPLIVTAGFATSINWNLFHGWMASLPAFIYQQALNPTAPQAPGPSLERAWAAALVLILLVMLLNLTARLIARYFAPKTGK
ncbi:MAG: phosphate ABC transporter permease PstA [Micrococcaceae bacterium]